MRPKKHGILDAAQWITIYPVWAMQNIPGDCYLEERGRGLSGMWIPESHPDLLISTLDVSPFQLEDRITATLTV